MYKAQDFLILLISEDMNFDHKWKCKMEILLGLFLLYWVMNLNNNEACRCIKHKTTSCAFYANLVSIVNI